MPVLLFMFRYWKKDSCFGIGMTKQETRILKKELTSDSLSICSFWNYHVNERVWQNAGLFYIGSDYLCSSDELLCRGVHLAFWAQSYTLGLALKCSVDGQVLWYCV